MDQVLVLDTPYIKDGFRASRRQARLGIELNPDIVQGPPRNGRTLVG
jgi:hypothetical protein